jgi:hypothetical protein
MAIMPDTIEAPTNAILERGLSLKNWSMIRLMIALTTAIVVVAKAPTFALTLIGFSKASFYPSCLDILRFK